MVDPYGHVIVGHLLGKQGWLKIEFNYVGNQSNNHVYIMKFQ